MSDRVCPICGAKAVDDDEPGYVCVDFECGKGPCDPCPHAERLLAEARATIARMTPVAEAAEIAYDIMTDNGTTVYAWEFARGASQGLPPEWGRALMQLRGPVCAYRGTK